MTAGLISNLDRKLLRDLWRLRGQVVAISLIIGSAVALLIMALSTQQSLEETAEAYYERYRFGEVFANVTRAPETLVPRIAAIPGVQTVETRISRFVTLEVPGFEEPVSGRVVSVPEAGQPLLNRLVLRAGRWIARGRPDEAIVAETLVESHDLRLGDRIVAILNGHKRSLTIVGVAMAPDFVYSIGPGALMPDDERFGVLWMGYEALAAAYDLDGAFDDVSLALTREAVPAEVVARLDRLLAPYGGIGAIERADQISNWFVQNELRQAATMATTLPTIFLAVAAFLTNMVMARVIATEREVIGLLKAFGFSNLAVAWHYAKLVVAIAVAGVLVGWVVGWYLARWNTGIQAENFTFPFLVHVIQPRVYALAAGISLAAALVGALGTVLRAASLPPAVAMRPPAPTLYRRGGFQLGRRIVDWFDQPTRMILRHTLRHPFRAGVTVLGFAMAVAVLSVALHWRDAIDQMIQSYFFDSQRQSLIIGLTDTHADTVLGEFRRLPGVQAVEPMRMVPVRIVSGRVRHRGNVTGVPATQELYLVRDTGGLPITLPPEGLAIATKLAEKLGVGIGDRVRVEVLDDRRPILEIPIAATFETYIGVPAFMRLEALNRLMRERPAVDAVHLRVDQAALPELYRVLKDMPGIASVMNRQVMVQSFLDTMGSIILVFIGFFSGFSSALALGVGYNAARISLSERGRELATLRVLGFTRWQISYILLGESFLLTAIALPFGVLASLALMSILRGGFDTELFRVPQVMEPATLGISLSAVLVTSVVSALVVRRRLDRLDLIEVLKSRE